jgi:hypothetical protein
MPPPAPPPPPFCCSSISSSPGKARAEESTNNSGSSKLKYAYQVCYEQIAGQVSVGSTENCRKFKLLPYGFPPMSAKSILDRRTIRVSKYEYL